MMLVALYFVCRELLDAVCCSFLEGKPTVLILFGTKETCFAGTSNLMEKL